MSISAVGADGKLCVYANARTHLIVDIVGVWTHIAERQPPPPVVVPNPGDQGDTVDPADPQLGDAPLPGDPRDPNSPDDPNNPATPNDPTFVETSNGGCGVVTTAPNATSGIIILFLALLQIRRRKQS